MNSVQNKNLKKSYKVSETRYVSLSIHTSGHQECIASHQWGPGIRDHFLLHHVIVGKGHLEINGQEYQLRAGDTFLIQPFSEVTYYADATDPWEYTWVGFIGDDAKNIVNVIGFTTDTPVLHHQANSKQITMRLLNIYKSRGGLFPNTLDMTAQLFLLLSELSTNNLARLEEPSVLWANKKNSTYQTYAQSGVDYIHSHYSYPISIQDIADYIGVSRSHLFRSFQETYQQSPKEYLTNFRIQQACLLLKHSNLSVSAIGSSVGFEDRLNFSKAFKKIMGVAPTHYMIPRNKGS